MNQALHVRCTSTSEIVWARLHGFPWWPALVVKPDGAGFQVCPPLEACSSSFVSVFLFLVVVFQFC